MCGSRQTRCALSIHAAQSNDMNITEHAAMLTLLGVREITNDLHDAALPSNNIRIWVGDLNVVKSGSVLLPDVLSPDEIERLGTFVLEGDALRFRYSRTVLRLLLSDYVEQAPETIAFSYTSNAKPMIVLSGTPLYFNISHSNECAIFAISRDGEIGVDVESINQDFDSARIAERFFTNNENRYLLSVPRERFTHEFLKMWVIKEACVKATGEGVHGIEGVEVMVADDGTASLQHREQQRRPKDWQVCVFEPLHGYIARVVY